MCRKLLLFIFSVTFLAGCKKDAPSPSEDKGSDTFNTYEAHFLNDFWKLNPDRATLAGYHKYDSLLVVPNENNSNALLDFIRIQTDSLSRFNTGKLSVPDKIDYQVLQNQLAWSSWQILVLKAYAWDPTRYNIIPAFAYILNENYAPLAKRLRNFYEKMADIPNYYKEAEKQIKNPVTELTEQAIEQQMGGVGIMEKDFNDSLAKTNIPKAEQKKMSERAKLAVESIDNYVSWLKKLKNDHPRSFRLGKELYEDKFKYEIQSAYTAQQLFNSATDRKKLVHHEMAKLSRQLWPKYFGKRPMPADSLELISRVLDTLSGKHASANEFQSAIEKQLPKLSAFIKAKDLVTLDPGKIPIVRKQPAYLAIPAVASMSAPGPYEKNGNSYFNVASLTGLSPEKAQSDLREYNQYTLQLLCMHEAIPGHYVQLLYANKAPGIIKAIFGDDATMEGWAVYGEQMMLDNGYDDEPEMKLMWYKWHLRSVCNAILDYSVHCNNMTKEQAITLLTREAFQQQAEAEEKWKRVTVTSVQLDSYYDGYKEIIDLRDAYKTQMADKYKLKDFNEKFLSYGNAPVKYIKTAMAAGK